MSPDLVQLHETVADRFHEVADKLGLTPEQRTKIKDAHAAFADKYKALRAARQELLQTEFKSFGEILTPEQRVKVKSYVEGHYAHAPAIQSVGERLREAADKLGLSTDQRTKIRETHQTFASRYRTLREERRDLLQSELKAVAAVLTPEQKEKVENFFEDRVVVVGLEFDPNDPHAITELRETIRERLDAAAEKLGLSADQRAKIKDIHSGFAEKYKEQHAKRKELRQEELKALGEILTPDQRDKVKSYIEDKVEAIRGR